MAAEQHVPQMRRLAAELEASEEASRAELLTTVRDAQS